MLQQTTIIAYLDAIVSEGTFTDDGKVSIYFPTLPQQNHHETGR